MTFTFTNRQDEPLTIETAVFEAIGAASVCWESMEGTGTFQDGRAKEIAETLLALIHDRTGVEKREVTMSAGELKWVKELLTMSDRTAARGSANIDRAMRLRREAFDSLPAEVSLRITYPGHEAVAIRTQPGDKWRNEDGTWLTDGWMLDAWMKKRAELIED